LTGDGNIIGTPLYMSPEQASSGISSAQSDMYSLGCVMFECLTGHTPFLGATALDTVLLHQTEPAPRLDDVLGPENIRREIVTVVDRLLAKDPGARFRDLDEVADIFNYLLGQEDEPVHDQGGETASASAIADGALSQSATEQRANLIWGRIVV